MPIHFAAVGNNGAVIAGTFLFSSGGPDLGCHIAVQSSTEGLTAPVDIMYFDRKVQAALVVLHPSDGKPAPLVVLHRGGNHWYAQRV